MAVQRPTFKVAVAWSLAVFMSGEVVSAQETTQKKIAEPVFRVSKLAGNDSTTGDRITKDAKADSVLSVEEEEKKPAETAPPAEKIARADSGAPSLESSSLLPSASLSDANRKMDSAGTLPTADASAPVPVTPAVAKSAGSEKVPHPLDPAIEIAYRGLDRMTSGISDYTAVLRKREAMNGRLGDFETMKIKVRNPRSTANLNQPFSVYMKFLKPSAGREVIYVEGQNDGNMLVYEPGIAGFKTHALKPDGMLAMRNNRHPVYEAGLENLVKKLVVVAERDRAAGMCEVSIVEGAAINGRKCTMIEVTHKDKKVPYDFYRAQVFIDDEMQVPVRYASYDWPSQEGGDPPLIEEYTYVNISLNVGLKDKDFDPSNSEYHFPGY